MAIKLKFSASLILAATAFPVSALNPIHDASVEFVAPIEKFTRPVWLAGGFYTDEASQKFRALVSYLHPLTPDFQIGLGTQTRWFEEPNNVRHLVAGAKFQPLMPWSIQLDALLGVANYAGYGITVTGKYRFEPIPILPVDASLRVGVLDALVWEPDYMVVSGSLVPRLELHRKLRAELEVFTATQFPGIHDYFSLDLGPSFSIKVEEKGWVIFGVILGVAGPNQADPRFSLMHQYGL